MGVRRASTDERDKGDSQVSSRNSGIAGLTKQVVRTSVPFLVAGALLATAFSPPTHAQAGAHNARAHAAFACVLTAHRPRYVTPNDIAAGASLRCAGAAKGASLSVSLVHIGRAVPARPTLPLPNVAATQTYTATAQAGC